MKTDRVEAFSDGVFAIAITLLVLDLRDPGPSRGLARALVHQWPSFAAYAVSFASIGIIWMNHNVLFRHLRWLDRPLVFLNLSLLLVVAFIPFPTKVLADYISTGGTDSHVAAGLYGATMTVLSLLFSGIWWRVSSRSHLLVEAARSHHARAVLRRALNGTVVYAAATTVSAVSAGAALATYAVVAVYFALPGRSLAVGVGQQDGKDSSQQHTSE